MSLNTYQKICAGFFAGIILYWIILFASSAKGGVYNNIFSLLYGLIPLLGGGFAAIGYRKWGGLSTVLGKAILLFGFGLFLWGCGQMVWVYYTMLMGIAAPYPSLADVFFLPSVFFYTLGTIYLAYTTGARFGLRSQYGRIYAVLAPLVVLATSYILIMLVGNGAQLLSGNGGILKSILDIVYPLGDAISFAVALTVAGLSFRYLGGLYKFDVIFILSGLSVMFVADLVFSYTTTLGTSYNGDFIDLIFAAGMFLLTCGILGFNKIKSAPAIA